MTTEQTLSWDTVDDNWACPGCLRRKPECEVPAGNGKRLRWLVEHHDHMRDYVKAYLLERYGQWVAVTQKHSHPQEFVRYLDQIKLLAQRFPHTLICIDCNEAESKIKLQVAADRFFSFHPVELHRAIIPAPKERHIFVADNMPFYREIYAKVEERLVSKRKETIRTLVDAGVSGKTWWGGPIQLDRIFSGDVLQREFHAFDSSKRIRERLKEGKPVYRWASWLPSEETQLRELVAKGIAVEEIAQNLGRTPTGIRYRMEKLGL